jgi:acetyl esterase/lipase
LLSPLYEVCVCYPGVAGGEAGADDVDDTLARNWTFLSYDYRKLSPASAHDILKDLHAAFTHYHTVLAPEHGLSATNVFVAGYSAGGYLAQLAGVHWEPKPLALLLVAPMGGRLLGGHYYGVKAEGEDGEEYKQYLPPHAEGKEVVGALAQTEDEEEWRRREKVAAQLCKRGVLLDVLTGVPGLSAQLREFAAEAGGAEGMEEDIAAEQKSVKPKSTGGCRSARTSDDSSRGSTNTTSETTTSPTTPTTPTSSNRLKSESFPKAPKKHPSHCPLLPPIAESSPSSLIQGLTHIIPQASRSLFPELLIDESFPPCYIVHGTADTTVLPAESAALEARLRRKQVPCELVMVEGASHQAMGLEGIYCDYIQGVMEFFGSRILPDEDEEEGLEEEEF